MRLAQTQPCIMSHATPCFSGITAMACAKFEVGMMKYELQRNRLLPSAFSPGRVEAGQPHVAHAPDLLRIWHLRGCLRRRDQLQKMVTFGGDEVDSFSPQAHEFRRM